MTFNTCLTAPSSPGLCSISCLCCSMPPASTGGCCKFLCSLFATGLGRARRERRQKRPATRARPTPPPTTPHIIANALVWDEDEDEEVLPPVEQEEPEDEGDDDGAGGKLEAAKTAEREGLDQLGVRLLVVVSFDWFRKKRGTGLTLSRSIDALRRHRCRREVWPCRTAKMPLRSCRRLQGLARRDRGY